MYGLITKLPAWPGRRDALALSLLDPEVKRPGCCSYVVAFDPKEDDAVWVTEAWMSEDAHRAALTPEVRDRLRPALGMIAVFGETTYTRPVGGVGL